MRLVCRKCRRSSDGAQKLKKVQKIKKNHLPSNKQRREKQMWETKNTTQAGEGKEESNDVCLV
jgi:hypothetical protein